MILITANHFSNNLLNIPDLILAYLNELNRDRLETKLDNLTV
ncbi:hypothetical protein [Nostoc sp.]